MNVIKEIVPKIIIDPILTMPITIPRKLTQKGELVVIPRKEYEEILRKLEKNNRVQLDKDLEKAIREVKQKKLVGPFKNVASLMKSLDSKSFFIYL